jgi:ATP-binding cassette subfamily F protein 3
MIVGRNMINADGIFKSYGEQELFAGASFKLNAGEKVGLVGRNGSGKTTLFRLIAAEELPDAGSIIRPRGYSIGYVQQEPAFSENTALGEGCRALKAPERENRWKVEKILAGLGFSEDDMGKHPLELSGGFQVRLNLAKSLVEEVDLLLLDEPNNYLDITSIRWLTQFLKGWRGELMLITHDRGFMDNVVTHTMGIYRKTLRKVKGDTSKLYRRLAMDEELYEKTRLKDERRRQQAEVFIRRFRAKARLASRVQSRIKALEKRGRLERLEKPKDLDFSFQSKLFNGKPVMHAREISFGYAPASTLFSSLSFSVGPFDRICVVGKNGKGKTTLLKVLAGRLAPLSGEITNNATASVAYYAQDDVRTLVDDRTVLEEIYASDADIDQQRARDICGLMMFEGDAALKKVKVLSGGEKNRLLLGTIIARPVNLLLLDEPTNHLDMESCDALLEAIDDFEGAVVMVTHNEMLLHGLAQRLIVFQSGNATAFEGGYQRFLEDRGWDEERAAPGREPGQSRSRSKLDRKEMRRTRAEILRERARELKPLEERVGELERAIASAEAELHCLYEEIIAASQRNESAKIAEKSIRVHALKQEIETRLERLEAASLECERRRSLFDKRMRDLDTEPGTEDGPG